MIKKETLKAYIDGVQHQYDCDDKVQKAFKTINGDNYNIGFISEKYSKGMDAVMIEYLGHVAHDYLSWWMWETNAGIGKSARGVEPHIFIGGVLAHDLGSFDDSFDKLYDYLTTLNEEKKE